MPPRVPLVCCPQRTARSGPVSEMSFLVTKVAIMLNASAVVDTALFILCLDYTEPKTASDLCMNMLCGTSEVEKGVQVGTCTNRWYDKLQIIVCNNGSAGINFEHTGVDGHTVLTVRL